MSTSPFIPIVLFKTVNFNNILASYFTSQSEFIWEQPDYISGYVNYGGPLADPENKEEEFAFVGKWGFWGEL